MTFWKVLAEMVDDGHGRSSMYLLKRTCQKLPVLHSAKEPVGD